MDSHTISIRTPENIEFSYEVAGLGSRFIANIIDLVIQSVVLSFLSTSLILGGFITFRSNPTAASWVLALALIAGFAIFVGYYMLFEVVWNGQTPGKRMVQIRVLKDGGYPISPSDAVVRNMLRSVDFLPFFYALGAFSILLNKSSKRIGDYVAGTIVVKEKKLTIPKPPKPLEAQASTQTTQTTDATRPSYSYSYRLTNEEIELISRFLLRRQTLKSGVIRERIAKKLAYPLARKLQVSPSLIQGREEEFLESLVST